MRKTDGQSKGAAILRSKPGQCGVEQITYYRGMSDFAGREAHVSTFGEQITGIKDAQLLNVFNYFVNPERTDTSLSSGSWDATIDKSRLKLTAGIAGVGEAILESIPEILYRPGYDMYALYTCAFDTYKAGTTQEHGVFDSENGYTISIESTGEIAINHYRAGVLISKTLQSEFLLDRLDGSGLSGFELNPQAMNIWRINYGYLGALPPSFEMYCGVAIGWVAFHYIDLIGIDNLLIVEDPFLPLRFRVESDGVNEVSMYSGSWQGGSIGPDRKRHLNDQFTIENSVSAIGGTYPLATIRNMTAFKSKVNKIPFDIDTFTGSVEGNKQHLLKLVLNGTLSGPTAYNPVDPSSVVEVDKTSTGITGGRIMRSYGLGKIDGFQSGAEYEEGEIRIFPGQWLTIVVQTTGTSDANGSLHWDELK